MAQALEVRRSRIHGSGVFAMRDFNKGDVVVTIDDSDIVPERKKLTPEQAIHIDVFVGLDGEERVTFMKAPEKFINTSCDSNVYIKTDPDAEVRRGYALKPISKGDEVTWDYAINSNEEWDPPVGCNCGSSRCRRIIRGNFFTLPREWQIEYLPLLDGPFRKKYRKEIGSLGL